MSDRKNVNKYYPPDWDPSKGSINTYVGQHPLRSRARKLDQGVLVVRFAMPFNIWCGGCQKHIAKGVRFNADKKKIDHYLGIPIFSFRMKCPLCPNYIEIHTDPKNEDYIVAEGGRRKIETWDPKETEIVDFISADDKVKFNTDPFFKLEVQQKDKRKGKEAEAEIAELQRISDKHYKNPYDVVRAVRKKFRVSHME
ncbi:CWC16 protein [Dimargaris cristalligena]|uniref:CWC16 protein n=1 Tax=Dimargaris cristalligena TaxID=215637 RepID=A0A4P9ZQW7_9FUNG|nr:CWC16 protein [Dimargaris cristalligena]|eukprot:RKP35767.1 CWC16 protein [Dimargaris cristalligena]